MKGCSYLFAHKNSFIHFFCFFFSSRRRHTRYWRDWSSDVCSSDLVLWTVRGLFYGLSGECFMDCQGTFLWSQGTVLWTVRGLFYGLSGDCFMDYKGTVLWTIRGLDLPQDLLVSNAWWVYSAICLFV